MLEIKERETKNTSLELLLSLLIVAMLGGLAVLSFADRRHEKKEQALKANLITLRQALNRYRLDHGRFPGGPGDFNQSSNPELLSRQLTQYTNASGEPARIADGAFRFGPYLSQIPVEPLTGSNRIWVDRSSQHLSRRTRSDRGEQNGGWYYRVRDGSIHANLDRRSQRSYLTLY